MGVESRRQHRIGVALDVRISGKDRYGLAFEEMTHSDNVSRGGCSFQTTHELEAGSELEIEIFRHVPGPQGHAPFFTTGLVLRTNPADAEHYTVGVRFTGPQFPTFTPESSG